MASTVGGKSKGRSNSNKGRPTPPNWQVVAPTTPDVPNPSTPIRNFAVTVTGTPPVRQPSPVTPLADLREGPVTYKRSPQPLQNEMQCQQGASPQIPTPVSVMRLEQELEVIVERAVIRDNAIVTPRACSTTQPIWQSPCLEERDPESHTVPMEFGAVCCQAIRENPLNGDENSPATGGTLVASRQLRLLSDAMLLTSEDHGVGSNPVDFQPLHVLAGLQERVPKDGNPV